MPANSKAQWNLMQLAKHNPEKVRQENKGVLGMSEKQLSEFTSGKSKGLPEKTNALNEVAKGNRKFAKKLVKK